MLPFNDSQKCCAKDQTDFVDPTEKKNQPIAPPEKKKQPTSRETKCLYNSLHALLGKIWSIRSIPNIFVTWQFGIVRRAHLNGPGRLLDKTIRNCLCWESMNLQKPLGWTQISHCENDLGDLGQNFLNCCTTLLRIEEWKGIKED